MNSHEAWEPTTPCAPDLWFEVSEPFVEAYNGAEPKAWRWLSQLYHLLPPHQADGSKRYLDKTPGAPPQLPRLSETRQNTHWSRYLKLSYLHLHLSDDYGFRIESERHPEIVSDEHFTMDEVRDLVSFAEQFEQLFAQASFTINADPAAAERNHQHHRNRAHPPRRLGLTADQPR